MGGGGGAPVEAPCKFHRFEEADCTVDDRNDGEGGEGLRQGTRVDGVWVGFEVGEAEHPCSASRKRERARRWGWARLKGEYQEEQDRRQRNEYVAAGAPVADRGH